MSDSPKIVTLEDLLGFELPYATPPKLKEWGKKRYFQDESDEKPVTQVQRIVRKFGGAPNFCRILAALGRERKLSSVYKWHYRGGLIPTKAWADIFAAARAEGIIITSEDIDPRSKPLIKLDLRRYPKLVIPSGTERSSKLQDEDEDCG